MSEMHFEVTINLGVLPNGGMVSGTVISVIYGKSYAPITKICTQKKPQIRHCLMFFLFPEKFERIVANSDKKLICRDLHSWVRLSDLLKFLSGGGLDSRVSIDKLIFQIRQALAHDHGPNIDFYFNPLQPLWGQDVSLPAPSNRQAGTQRSQAHEVKNQDDDANRFEHLEQNEAYNNKCPRFGKSCCSITSGNGDRSYAT